MRAYHIFALLTLPVAIVLVWWGAMVTTNDVGLAVPDWPLGYGKLNPPVWLQVPALRDEHGHRWWGTIIGILVLVQYFWQFSRYKPRLLEAAGILLCGAGFLYLVNQKVYWAAGVIGLMGLSWSVMTWIGHRWPLLRGLTVFALLMVILQAALGGARVLEMSDSFGVMHGTFGQIFFCMLVTLAFASSKTWHQARLLIDTSQRIQARAWSAVLFSAVFLQLIFGAVVRHTQREHLAAGDILTTGGVLLPDATDMRLLMLHKYWGFLVALLILHVAWRSRRWLVTVPRLRWISPALLIMPINQVVLGIYVVLTGKSFWVTNFHVLNGLGLLVLSFLLALSIWAATSGIGLNAQPEADKRESLA